MTDSPIDSLLLEMESMIGFSGKIPNGYQVHPDREHVVYAVGCTVVIENLSTRKQQFLSGHTNNVSCLAISKSGKYIASGQITHMGFKADVIIWNFEDRYEHCKLILHRVKVESLAFSPNDKYLVSLGGGDDGSVVVWDVEKKEAVCGSPAQVMSAGMAVTVAYSNLSDETFVTGGDNTLRVWKLDRPNRKIWPTEVQLGKNKRIVTCVEFAADDSFFFFGTTTGDIFAINSSTNIFQVKGPKDTFSLGVTALCRLKTGDFLVGAGDGTVAIVRGMAQEFKRTNKSAKLSGTVTSISLRGQGHQFFAGTEAGHVYRFNYAEFAHELALSCHYSAINDVAFPYGFAGLYATCSYENIRIWNSNSNQELLRINVPNVECNTIDISRDGKTIFSGWSDGKIRAYYPESGKEMYTIQEAHSKGVTALASFSDCQHIVSGGGEGSVRVWQISTGHTARGLTFTTKLMFALKEHQNKVTCIKLRKNDQECVTSSFDGSCVIWDLEKQARYQMIRTNTLFNYVCYHPDEHQIITTGTDRKIGYWETYDALMIREIEGSKGGSINSMDISGNGEYFVSCGDDKLLKVWLYQDGKASHIGIGHSAPIRRAKISPDEKFIISVSEDGAILRWKFPH